MHDGEEGCKTQRVILAANLPRAKQLILEREQGIIVKKINSSEYKMQYV